MDTILKDLYKQGNINDIRRILDSVNNNDKVLITKLFVKSCKYDHMNVVKYLFDFVTIEDICHGLNYAIKHNNIHIINYLVANIVDIHKNAEEMLRLSCHAGYIDLVKFIVSCNGEIHALSDAALCYACNNGHMEIVEYLVNNNANIHAESDWPLLFAISSGHMNIIKYLINCNADIYARNNQAFLISAVKGNLEILQFLMQICENDDITCTDIDEMCDCILPCVCRNGHIHIIEYIISLHNNCINYHKLLTDALMYKQKDTLIYLMGKIDCTKIDDELLTKIYSYAYENYGKHIKNARKI